FLRTAVNDFMDSVHHIWCPLSSQEYQDLPDGAETTLTDTSTSSELKFDIWEKNAPGRERKPVTSASNEGLTSGAAG
ncbi:hypothetical protein L8S34_23315, partial [Enterobacter roggenkampii]|uniref:hypothetical protein n=1 Tax=Enterobacter roggenkampii TaxID=1812935 RepID=UPI00200699EB